MDLGKKWGLSRSQPKPNNIAQGNNTFRIPLDSVSRNRHIFPVGCGDLTHSKTPPLEFTLTHLDDILVKSHNRYDLVQDIYIESMQYCKSPVRQQTEFIIFTVKTEGDSRLQNSLILDRIGNVPTDRTERDIAALISSSFPSPKPIDRVRVSFDGTLRSLLSHCGISKYTALETIEFTDPTLPLYELITLARVASGAQHGELVPLNQCHWFTSLVWDCTRHVFPFGAHSQNNDRKIRSNFARQRTDFKELCAVSEDAKEELMITRKIFSGSEQANESTSTLPSIAIMLNNQG